MKRFSIPRALATTGLAVALAAVTQAAVANVNPVIQWNKNLLVIVRTKGAQPATIHSTRSFALLHAAIYDAVNSINNADRPYRVHIEGVPANASQAAAADQAAHDVLVNLYPTFQTMLDSELAQGLAEIPNGVGKTAGEDVGRAVAAALLGLREDDGSAATPPLFIFKDVPGRYQSTPPNFPAQPSFTHWPKVRTWALDSSHQFRPGPPPALNSAEYTEVFNEVKSVGIISGSTATPDQQLTGSFWNGSIQNYWNEITQTAATAKNLNIPQTARLFALVNLALADSVIAFYDAKYTYNFWRPVTAIRAAANDGNPATAPDLNWLPEVTNTATDPSYPGAHATISYAAAFVLQTFFGTDFFRLNVTSEVMPGTVRSFEGFGAAAQEASLSRVFAGVHFRSDEDTGQELGTLVADFVKDHVLLPVPHDRFGEE